MEVINRNNSNNPEPSAWTRHIYLGIVLIAVGAIWMMYNFDLIPYRFFDIIFSWEMLLMVLGGYLLSVRKWVGGCILLVIGGFFFATNLLGIHIPFNKVVLPLLFIAGGVAVLFSRKN